MRAPQNPIEMSSFGGFSLSPISGPLEACAAAVGPFNNYVNKIGYTANIFEVIFTVFNCVQISSVISLYGLHFIAAPSTV